MGNHVEQNIKKIKTLTVHTVKDDHGCDGVNWHSRAHSQFSRHLAQFSLLRDDSDLNATYAPTLYHYRVSPDKMSFFKPMLDIKFRFSKMATKFEKNLSHDLMST